MLTWIKYLLYTKYCAENIISINPLNDALKYYNIHFQLGTEYKEIMYLSQGHSAHKG